MGMKHPSPFHKELEYVVGVDIGQSVDPTAVAIVERYVYADADPVYSVRHLERLPLGMDYVQQVTYVGELMRRAPLCDEKATLIIDHSGVGRPIFDLFSKAGLRPIGLTITAGEQAKRNGGNWHVSKLQLISCLQAELHQKRLRISDKLKDAQALARELQDFRVNISSAGNAVFGARVGRHDDLVLALAIATWEITHQLKSVCIRNLGF